MDREAWRAAVHRITKIQTQLSDWTDWVAKPCLILCDPMDCRIPGSSVHMILQGRILEWFAISSSKASSWHRDQTHVSCIDRHIVYHWATWEARFLFNHLLFQYMIRLIWFIISILLCKLEIFWALSSIQMHMQKLGIYTYVLIDIYI